MPKPRLSELVALAVTGTLTVLVHLALNMVLPKPPTPWRAMGTNIGLCFALAWLYAFSAVRLGGFDRTKRGVASGIVGGLVASSDYLLASDANMDNEAYLIYSGYAVGSISLGFMAVLLAYDLARPRTPTR